MGSFEDTLGLLRAAGDPTRLRILIALERRPLCVCELVALVDLGQPTVSRHLGILQRAGLVDRIRDGYWTEYRLAEPAVAEPLRDALRDTLRDLAARDPEVRDLVRRAAVVDRRRLGATAPGAGRTCHPKTGAKA